MFVVVTIRCRDCFWLSAAAFHVVAAGVTPVSGSAPSYFLFDPSDSSRTRLIDDSSRGSSPADNTMWQVLLRSCVALRMDPIGWISGEIQSCLIQETPPSDWGLRQAGWILLSIMTRKKPWIENKLLKKRKENSFTSFLSFMWVKIWWTPLF